MNYDFHPSKGTSLVANNWDVARRSILPIRLEAILVIHAFAQVRGCGQVRLVSEVAMFRTIMILYMFCVFNSFRRVSAVLYLLRTSLSFV